MPLGTPKALAQRASMAVAIIRSRSGENRGRLEHVSGGAARRALPMLEDTADAEAHPIVAVEETLAEHAARQRSEANNQREILVDILHNELRAAMSLMEHRER